MSLPTTACQASLTSGLRSSATNTASTPGSGQRRRGVDAVDAGPGEGAADEAGVQHAGARCTSSTKRAVAGEQAVILDAVDPGSRISGGDGLGHAKRSMRRRRGRYDTSAQPTIDLMLSSCPASLPDTRFSLMSIWHSRGAGRALSI